MKAILPVLDESGQRPLYLQLYDYIRDAILAGDIAEGEKLPSLRGLAKSTGLSLTTVGNAYNQLLVEGYIHSRASSGYYADKVAGTGIPAPQDAVSADTSDETVPLEIGEFDTKLLFDNPAWPRTGPTGSAGEERTSDAGVPTVPAPGDPAVPAPGDPTVPAMRYDPDCFDFNKWKKCMNRILNDHSSSLFFEGSPQGEEPLRREIAGYLYRSRGFRCDPDQIFIAAGTQQITGLLASMLRDLDIEHVALEDPGYAPVRNTFRDRGFAITDVSVDEDGIDLDSLPVNIRSAAYVSPSNNSFTGSLMPIGRRYEMLGWARDNDSYIIEDDYDSELRYFGRPIPPIRSLADDDRVIYLGSFSSTLFTAVRISYMVLPHSIAHDFTERLSDYSQTCSKLEQLTLANFMETGLYQTHIRKLRKLYSQKLTAATEVLRRSDPGFIEIKSNASGINLLLKVDLPSMKSGAKGTDPHGSAPGPEVGTYANPHAVAFAKSASKKEKAPEDPRDKLIKDAESLGISAVASGDLILLYYNRIPLEDIPDVFSRLVSLWRS